MQKQFLGIDLGGTEVKIAVVNVWGEIIERRGFKEHGNISPEKVVADIVRHSMEMKAFKSLSGTGVGVAGDIDQEKGVVRFSPNLKTWKKIQLGRMLSKHLPKPIVVDNDANAAAIGAYYLEAKAKVKNLVCITLGTGVGGGLILDGKLYRGATGTAGEIGHMPLNESGPACKCGGIACIERYVGAQYISQEAKDEVRKGKGRKILKLVDGNIDLITPRVLADAANMGDPLAKAIWNRAGERIGVVVAGIINFINPEMIVISGGISLADELLLNPIKATVKKRAFATSSKACQIKISHFNEKLGMVGAALLAR